MTYSGSLNQDLFAKEEKEVPFYERQNQEGPHYQSIAAETGIGIATDFATVGLLGIPVVGQGLYYGTNFAVGYGANALAQWMRGDWDDFSHGEALAAGGFQTIPMGTTAKGLKGLRRAAAKGAVGSAGMAQLEVGIDEQRRLTGQELVLSSILGGTVAGGFKAADLGSVALGDVMRNPYQFAPEGSLARMMSDTGGGIVPPPSDDIYRLQYKADIAHNDKVKLKLKEWGMKDGKFSINTFFSKVRKDPTTRLQEKSSTEGREFIELFLTPEALKENFNKLRSDPQGAHQAFKSRFVDMLEQKGLDPSLINYHHIAGLYDALPLYEGLTYGSDEWWDLTTLLLERNIRPGASGFKEKTNFMSILGMAQQQGQKGKDAMPHGVAHLFYKHKLGSQRTFNKDNDLFFSKSEIEAIQKNLDPITRKKIKGPYKDPMGILHNSYREYKANLWSDVVNESEFIAQQAMKQWEAVNPKGNMDFNELVKYLNTLDNKGLLKKIDSQYQVPLIPKLIAEITEASKGLEKMNPVSEEYKLALVSKLLDMNLPPTFITSYYKKISGTTIRLDKVKNIAKNMKINKPINTKKKKYTK